MKSLKTLDRFFKFLSFMIVLYLFFSLLNWTFKTNEWGGASIFLFGLAGIIVILDEFN